MSFQSVGIVCVSETKALESLRSVLKLEYEKESSGNEIRCTSRVATYLGVHSSQSHNRMRHLRC